MNLFKKNYNLICLFCFFINSAAFADQCPSAQIIKERKISRDLDWSIDERKTLDDLLSVEKLYSARIKNNGEFIACYYSASRSLIRLDGAPLEQNCVIQQKSGEWLKAENSEQVCKEEDLNLCIYEIHCTNTDERND